MSTDDWTDDELRYLVERRGIGVSFQDIANNLRGRTKSACIAELRRCVEESHKYDLGGE